MSCAVYAVVEESDLYVHREINFVADCLANFELFLDLGYVNLGQPSACCEQVLIEDTSGVSRPRDVLV